MSVTFSVTGRVDYLNVANGNYARLMTLLGRDEAPWGGEYAGVALMELALDVQFVLDQIRAMPDVLDAGRPDVEVPNPGGCRVIEGGTSPGYYEHRLTRLLELVEAALESDEPLRFG